MIELNRNKQVLLLDNVSKQELLNKQVFGVIKPVGYSSAYVVNAIKKQFDFKKVGHGGTLDPLASGVLVIGVERGTKLLTHNLNDNKSYDLVIKFGEYSSSYDLGTPIIKKMDVPNFSVEQITQVIQDKFVDKTYYQVPPKYSAKKINGVRAYQLARSEADFHIQPSLVKINHFKVNKYDQINSLLYLSLNVSKGFYLRSFAIDLANKLKTVGVVVNLTRTVCKEFNLHNSYRFKIDSE